MTTWEIQDWAGNICLQGREFDSFEDADSALTEFIENRLGHRKDDEDVFNEERGEYYILPAGCD